MNFESLLKKTGVWILFLAFVTFFAIVGDVIPIVAALSVPGILGTIMYAIHVTFDDLT